ncbi:MAG TPA: hypothetical protein VHW26_01065 [Solirubrobacteraceae bacterium]|jgi:hypothetical protein|nr:hypothetical protein [Solirubrobacteraceae bacterium]
MVGRLDDPERKLGGRSVIWSYPTNAMAVKRAPQHSASPSKPT